MDEKFDRSVPPRPSVSLQSDGAPDGIPGATNAMPAIDQAPPPGHEGHARRATSPVLEGKGEESRKRRRLATDEGGGEGEALAGFGSMVRHLSLLTKELTEAQRTIGTLMAEHDLLHRQLIDAGTIPVSLAERVGTRSGRAARVGAQAAVGALPTVVGEDRDGRTRKEARLDAKIVTQDERSKARAAKEVERSGIDEPKLSPEEYATRAQEAGRRRRRIALTVFVALAALIWLGGAMEVPVGDYLSRGGLAAAPVVGPLFQVMLVGFLVFRFVRVGGKARQWLYPSADPSQKRRRR